MSHRDSVVPIVVTPHAKERARERCPGFKAARIVEEIRSALHDNRISSRKPADFKGVAYPNCLYAWNDHRVYALKATDNALVVITTVARPDRSEEHSIVARSLAVRRGR